MSNGGKEERKEEREGGKEGTSGGHRQQVIAALQTGQAKMSVAAGVALYQEHTQKLGARAIHAQALGIGLFSVESVGGKPSLKMPAVSKADSPGAQVWCVSHGTSFLWR